MTSDRPEERAVRVHNEQAALFRERYRALAAGDHANAFVHGRSRMRHLVEARLGPGDGRRLLDVGCGSGDWLAWLEAMGFRVDGLDPAAAMLAQARADGARRLVRGDARALPYADRSFDVVIAIEVVRYLPDPGAALREMRRVLAPGGTLVVTAAPRFALHGYALLNPLVSAIGIPGLTRVRQHFTTARELRRAFLAAGLRDPEIAGTFVGPFVWLDRVAPRVSRALLQRWSPLDDLVERTPALWDISNHLIGFARA